ncbi:MAG: nucleotidyltransferase domain-containing protein [Longimicrobiales bacterium]
MSEAAGIDRDLVLNRRKRERDALLENARRYVALLSDRLSIRAAVVFGSVARGDFNLWSDIDLLLVIDDLPERWLDRAELLDPRPPRVQAIAWTPDEWAAQKERNNPILMDAATTGVWLRGSATELQRAGQ